MISIIITTKNEEGSIIDLLESLKSQTYSKFEIIVVDNNSSDKTKLIAKKYNARVFNIGPERSIQRNYGVNKAIGEKVLILDADMKLSKNVLLELSKAKEEVAIIPEKSYGTGFWTKFKVFEREFYEGYESIEAPRFFSKSVFLKYGGYDERITGPEDFDLPLRMRKDGVKVGRIKSYIWHNEKKFSPLKSAKKKFYYASKAGVYVRKHPEMVIVQGNMILRPIFFKKWKKMINHPFLTFGMFFIKTIEMIGVFFGFVYHFLANLFILV
ncbi:MAG: glycosyltransferase [Patescibacteria group bacterium]